MFFTNIFIYIFQNQFCMNLIDKIENINKIQIYNEKNINKKMTKIIGICGGSASGKTSFAKKLEDIKSIKIKNISLDGFYKDLEPTVDPNEYNFDSKNALDRKGIEDFIICLQEKKPYLMPKYDFKTHKRTGVELINFGNYDIIVIESIFAFCFGIPYDLKIFIDVDSDIRLSRRIRRDIETRGRSLESVIRQYEKFVKPAYDKIIYPTRKDAHIIVNHGAENDIALEMVKKFIENW